MSYLRRKHIWRLSRRPLFTLVELLVVIAIIGILAELLLPSLRKALDSSRTALCINNLKQIGISVASYAGSNNDFLPYGYNVAGANVVKPFVQPVLAAFMQMGGSSDPDYYHTQVTSVPNASTKNGLFGQCPSTGSGIKQTADSHCSISDYGYVKNTTKAASSTFFSTDYGKARRLQQFHKPSTTMVFADSEQPDWDHGGFTTAFFIYNSWVSGAMGPMVDFRHASRCCLVYADGHVEARDCGYFLLSINDVWGTNSIW